MVARTLVALLCLGSSTAFITPFVGRVHSARNTGSCVTMMAGNIAVFGGNGLTGSEVVYQALQRGDKVTAFCRDPSKLVYPPGVGVTKAGTPLSNENLKTVQGTVTDLDDVRKVFSNGPITGVAIALGGKTKDVGTTMLTDGTSNIITAMKEKGVKKVATVTSIGTGDSENQAPFFFKVLMYTAMKSIFADKNEQEKLFFDGPGQDLDFTIVRPGGLTVEPPTGVINVIKGEAGSISRADVADFILGAISDKDFPYLKQAPCISSVGGTSWVKDRSGAARGEMAK
ncbi:Flavine reductase [Ectocarpus siliculosus]|uniref:Flavine reductase n=1 Tax=Ectocarpus siliculosus TaxID=2880 RepID=D7FYW5_ECTSI|nr:Flavine reductase [Ectocarpus siliculosus]|eukprot:CBJ26607.1 Flavine reductase [Ectocarpus siliculosus]